MNCKCNKLNTVLSVSLALSSAPTAIGKMLNKLGLTFFQLFKTFLLYFSTFLRFYFFYNVLYIYANNRPLFELRICTLHVDSAPFFVPSTSFCSLSSCFTSSCAYHLITVTTFALTVYRSLGLSLQTLKLFHKIIFSAAVLLVTSGTAFMDLNLYRTKWALAFVCFSFFLYFFCFWLRVLD